MGLKVPLLILLFVLIGYVLFTNVKVTIELVSKSNESAAWVDDAPALGASKESDVEANQVTGIDRISASLISAPGASTATKPKGKSSDAIDIERMAKILTRSFHSKDGIASEDQPGFDVTFTNLNTPTESTCHCDLVSVDCLDSIACIPHLNNPQHRHALAWIGLQMRRAIKTTSVFDGLVYTQRETPPGKNLQYSTFDVWKLWRSQNVLPKNYDRRTTSIFVDETWYPDCLKKDHELQTPRYHGFSCLFQGMKDSEDSGGTILEDEAIKWFNDSPENGPTTKRRIRELLKNFVREHQPQKNPETGELYNSDDVAESGRQHLSPLGNLIMFAHITRMVFNRRPFLDKIYREKVTSTGRNGDENLSSNSKIRTTNGVNDYKEPFNVALHMRRGDSCGGGLLRSSDYKWEASPLHSPAQTGADRNCYKTNVYLDAIRRIRLLVPKTRPLHVYLATDDAGDVVNEIMNEEEIIEVERWHFLNYSRHHFDYNADSIEAIENRANQPTLGETAIADLWHLSHGHAFVGHLGSRFGKVAWLLATARHNTFIPFFTVDGHSFCCEIDEPCGKMKSFVTVDNCMTFGHEYIDFEHEGNSYWEEGSLARKTIFLEQQDRKQRERRKRKRKSGRIESI